jgi:hypothetical protein
MNTGIANMPETALTPLDQQTPVKAEKVKSKRVRAPKKKDTDDLRLPVLVELTYTVSILFLIFVSLTMMVTSFISGTNLLNLVLRTGVAILVIGSLVTVISSQISSGMLAAIRAEKEEFGKAQAEENEPQPAAELADAVQAEA